LVVIDDVPDVIIADGDVGTKGAVYGVYFHGREVMSRENRKEGFHEWFS
jgi:hypothetical protein